MYDSRRESYVTGYTMLPASGRVVSLLPINGDMKVGEKNLSSKTL
jgi:hypothetical protein